MNVQTRLKKLEGNIVPKGEDHCLCRGPGPSKVVLVESSDTPEIIAAKREELGSEAPCDRCGKAINYRSRIMICPHSSLMATLEAAAAIAARPGDIQATFNINTRTQ